MDAKTAQALEESILKWRENLKAVQEKNYDFDHLKISGSDCSLCKIHQRPTTPVFPCQNCPVYLKTKRPLCHTTPYAQISLQVFRARQEDPDFSQETLETLVVEEIAFLESLREEGTTA